MWMKCPHCNGSVMVNTNKIFFKNESEKLDIVDFLEKVYREHLDSSKNKKR